MFRSLVFVLLSAISFTSLAQDSGTSAAKRRYLNQIFDATQFTGDIVYGEKMNDRGNKKEKLKLRVFEPAGDAERKRPLFLLTPGGGFVVTGETWMNEFAEQIAKAGYVVALNSYRLSSDISTPENYLNALAKAVEDQKAALAYLLKDAQNENRFGIDPTSVFIGGHSAGAITSMHTAYLDTGDPLEAKMAEMFRKRKLLPDPKNPSPLKGVINLSGLLTNLAVMNRNDVPLLTLHGDGDTVINVDKDQNIFGAIAINAYADIVETQNEIYVIKGALHNDTSISAVCEECIPLIKRFMFNQLQNASLPKKEAE
ncbi:MAG: alpha/beta hydrolase fold domain-containing protein [Cellvibrionaceae bacterium]|nr:alpha/beta hydrolase fold domain-containing protein [Cellvibrionaceae bacterium]